VSGAVAIAGVVLVVVGAAGVVLGGWAVVQQRRPPWLSAQRVPAGRERAWGAALLTLGLGAVGLGLSDSLGLGVLGVVGILLIVVGAVLLRRAGRG
jgi:hypothetical protein